jgi:hypothetical protein
VRETWWPLPGGADPRQQVKDQGIVGSCNVDRLHGNGNRFGTDLDVDQLQGVKVNQIFPAAQGAEQRGQWILGIAGFWVESVNRGVTKSFRWPGSKRICRSQVMGRRTSPTLS